MSPPQSHHTPVRDAVFWFDRQEPTLPPLRGDVTAGAVVVGGGMMGLMCARTLAARGVSVCLVEANTCGGAASGRSSGFITPDSELEFQDLVQRFGRANAESLWRFALSGVDSIREAIRESDIDCDFRVQDAFYVASSPGAEETVRKEHETREASGLKSQFYPADTLPTALGATGYFGGLRFGGTFGIDAHRCCVGLRRQLIERDVRVFEQSPVTNISAHGVETAMGAVRAPQIFICTDRALPKLGLARREIFHAQTFLAISEPLRDSEVARIFPDGPMMVWDTGLVYRYFRLTGEQRLLVGGGTLISTYARREKHRPEAVARRLSRYLAQHFPGLSVPFAAAWPGLIGISKDFAPIVGRDPHRPSVRFASGAAGLPWAAALGRYLAEQALDRRDEFDALLSANRNFPIGPKIQGVIGRQAAFALSHGIMKL